MISEYIKVSVTAAERVCLGSLLLEWVQMHWLCSFWGMALAMTACEGGVTYATGGALTLGLCGFGFFCKED